MSYTINQQAFDKALKTLKRNVDGRPSHPVLGCYLFEFGSPVVTVTSVGSKGPAGSGSFSRATVYLTEGYYDEAGTEVNIAVPHKQLSEVISSLPKDSEVSLHPFTVTDNLDKTKVTYKMKVVCGSMEVEIEGINPDDFPIVCESGYPDSPQMAFVPAAMVATFLKDTLYSASKDPCKANLCAVDLSVSGEDFSLSVAATDGHRLSHIELIDADYSGSINLTIPRDIADQLSKALGTNVKKMEGDVEFTQIAARTFRIRYGKYELAFQGFTQTYPNYRQLFPENLNCSAMFGTKELTNALSRVEKIANAENGVVKFEFDAEIGQVAISAGGYVEKIPFSSEGNVANSRIAFNVNYLLDALKGPTLKSSDSVFLEFNSPTTPAVITPKMKNTGENFRYLIMPVQVREW